MDEAYKNWKTRPNPDTMGELLHAAEPVIQSAVQSYGGGNVALRSKARLLAAKAFESYDPRHGTKLRTHLMTQLQPLTREAKSYATVARVPERVTIDLYHINQASSKLRDELGRDPTEQELADHTGLATRRISHVKKFARGEMAESGLKESDEGDDSILYPGVSKVDQNQVWLEYVHHDLDPINKKILEWKTGYNGVVPLSTNEIAAKLHLTAGAISQRTDKIAKRLAEGRMVL